MSLRILCANPPSGAFVYVTNGWGNAFKDMGHQFQKWDGSETMLKQIKPHIYLGCSGHPQCFPDWARKEYNTKIGIHVNPHGEWLRPIHGVNVNESQKTINWTISQKPDFVFGYAFENKIVQYWDKWEQYGFKVYPVPTGGDAIHFKNVGVVDRFNYPIGFLGGIWGYKAHDLNKLLKPLIKHYGLKMKHFGWGWPNTTVLQKEEDVAFLSSILIGPCICEAHTKPYGIDVPERIHKLSLCNTLAISDVFEDIDNYYPNDVMPRASSVEEFISHIDFYLNNITMREDLVKKQRIHSIKNHSYHARIKVFLQATGYIDEAVAVDLAIERLI